MSFLSKFNFTGRFAEVIRRFPVVMVFISVTTITLFMVIDTKNTNLFRLPLAGFIGFLAMLNWTIFSEVYQLSRPKYWTGVAVLTALLGIYYLQIPRESPDQYSCFWYFTAGLSAILHFLLAVIPFFRGKDNTAFTNYNIYILTAWFQSALYGLIFYLSLTLSVLAMDQLFDIRLDNIIYLKLFILVTGLLQTPFFLSEFPDRFDDHSSPAPKSVFRILTSYVLIPVTVVFGLIIYAYFGRVVLTGHSMVDWAFVMNIWFLGTGLLTWLFTGYFENGSDNTWMAVFRKWFPISAILPCAMLFYSLYRNIDTYGIREELYFGSFLATFLALAVLFFVINRNGDKRLLPVLLCILSVVLFMGGPVSMCKVPVTSMQKKLVSDLTRQGIIRDEVLQIDSSVFYQDTNGLITSKLFFLESHKSLGFIKQYDKKGLLHQNADSVTASSIIELLRLGRVKTANEELFWNIFEQNRKVVDIHGFEKMIPVKNKEVNMTALEFLAIDTEGKVSVHLSDTVFALPQLVPRLYDMALHPDADKVITDQAGTYSVMLIIHAANGENRNNEPQLTFLDASVLIKKNTK